MRRVLILADSLFWFKHALRCRQVAQHGRHDGPDSEVVVGTSSKFASPANLENRDTCEQMRAHLEEVTDIGHLPHYVCDSTIANRNRFSAVLSLHCTEIFKQELIDTIPCYNIHPGYLPDGRGWHPVTWARYTGGRAGATLHKMDHGIDTGPIIDRIEVPYSFEDECGRIHHQVRKAEEQLLNKWFERFIDGDIEKEPGVTQESNGVPTRTKADYAELAHIPIGSRMTAGELINRLAALTHGDTSNARLVDAKGQEFEVGVTIRRVP